MSKTGTQTSASWAVSQAAEHLATSAERDEREVGRSLRCCEVLGVDQVDEDRRERYTQGIRVTLRFYQHDDLRLIQQHGGLVATAVSKALGLWHSAVQLDLDLFTDDATWLGKAQPYRRGGTGLRLDRYLTDEVLERLTEEKKGLADWTRLAERSAEARILLRRLRYRLGVDYGNEGKPNYAVWTTVPTRRWARQWEHDIESLVWTLSRWVDDSVLLAGSADLASSLDTGYWGEVDTESDPIRILPLTTETGVTNEDVNNVFERAGNQIEQYRAEYVARNKSANHVDPLLLYIERLRELLDEPHRFEGVDILFLHRGGGVNPRRAKWGKSNVPDNRRRELLDLCIEVRDLGIEVVVALGHADISILDWPGRQESELPLGIFEATTPTAGAAWILQEHVNPRLVDKASIFGQPLST